MPALPVAIPAEDRPLAIRLKRELGDLGATAGTGPIALVHFPFAKILVVHLLLSASIKGDLKHADIMSYTLTISTG